MSQILTFPSSLRAKADDGDAYVSFILDKNTSPDTGKSVNLYLPMGISVADNISYNSIDLGFDKARQAFQSDQLAQEDILARVIKEAAGNSNEAVAGFVAGRSIEARLAVNPFTSVAFEGTGIRSFDFEFNMIPESAEESKTINEIENFFRKYMYPEAAGGEGNLSLKYPPLFEIKFYVNGEESKYLPKIYNSYLTSLTTTFNSSTNAYHANGAPVETKITLSFQESKALIRNDLYSEDSTNEG